MNVCYILKSYPRLSQTFILHELLELERQGVNLTIIARQGSSDELLQEPYQTLKATVLYLPSAYMHKPEAWIAPVIGDRQIQHIHAHFATWAAATAMAVSATTGIPYSFTAHAHDIFHEGVEAPALAEKIAHARFMVTVTDYNRAYLEALMRAEQREGHITRLYNGVDLQRLPPPRASRDQKLIVSVGRLIPKKGFQYLIEACRLIKSAGLRTRCVIIGEGEQRAVLEQQVARAGLQDEIILLGAQPHALALQIVQNATVFVLPCVISADGDRDALPTVLLEAMALGTPVISTHVSGIPEIISNGQSGLLVAERDASALAQAIGALLDSQSLRAELSSAARTKICQDFNLATNVERLKQLFSTGG